MFPRCDPPPVKLRVSPSGLGAYVLERHPFALAVVREVLEACGADRIGERDPSRVEALRVTFRRELRRALDAVDAGDIDETTPGVSAVQRLDAAHRELIDACDGFLAREAIRASITPSERLELLRGMILTRAVDNRLKQFFLSGEVQYKGVPFQGKGFRSLGQEAIYGAALRLRRGAAYRDQQQGWLGDVVGPIIRDVGVALAMRPEPTTIRMVLNAQMGKQGPPMEGKDLHIGDLDWGILPAAAPLTISTLTIAGMAMAFARQRSERVAVSFIGEGGSSLGEWHEAINLCAARRLPAVFCVENNQTALSTPLREQSAVRVFADKAVGYGVPGLTLDGTDPEAIASAFAWAADRARASAGPTLIELVCMRMCGHAHHDDMLYLGKEPSSGWSLPRRRARDGVRRAGAVCVLEQERPDCYVRAPARGGRADQRRRCRPIQGRGRRSGRDRSPSGDRGCVARADNGRVRRVCRGTTSREDRASRADRTPPGESPARPPSRRTWTTQLAARKNVSRGGDAGHRRCAAPPIRGCSSTAKTWEGSTATRSCCSVLC